MGIFQSFDEDSNGGSIICEFASFDFHFELMDVGSKEIPFPVVGYP